MRCRSSLGRALNDDGEQSQIGRGDPTDPRGLAQGFGSDLGELLAGLDAEAADVLVADCWRNPLRIVRSEAFDRGFLAHDVAGILEVDLESVPMGGVELLVDRFRENRVKILRTAEPLTDGDSFVAGGIREGVKRLALLCR